VDNEVAEKSFRHNFTCCCVCLIIALHNLSLFLHGTCLRAYYVKANWLSEQIIAVRAQDKLLG
jgi:hypothetical protein